MHKNSILDTGLVTGSSVIAYLGAIVPTALSILTIAILIGRLVIMRQDYRINKKKLNE